jgi:hypothetical protein
MTLTVLESGRDLTLIRSFIRSLFIGSRPLPPFEEKTVLSIWEGLLPVASHNFQAYTREAATLKFGEVLGSRLFPYT